MHGVRPQAARIVGSGLAPGRWTPRKRGPCILRGRWLSLAAMPSGAPGCGWIDRCRAESTDAAGRSCVRGHGKVPGSRCSRAATDSWGRRRRLTFVSRVNRACAASSVPRSQVSVFSSWIGSCRTYATARRTHPSLDRLDVPASDQRLQRNRLSGSRAELNLWQMTEQAVRVTDQGVDQLRAPVRRSTGSRAYLDRRSRARSTAERLPRLHRGPVGGPGGSPSISARRSE